MAHGFDIRATIKSTIEKILRIDALPLVLCTDSKSLYDCFVKLRTTQEKGLIVVKVLSVTDITTHFGY
jgi:hypothetical protein